MYTEIIRDSFKPSCVKWFSDNELKVLEVEAGFEHVVVKTIDKDGKPGFYGINNETGHKDVFGYDSNIEKVYKDKICKFIIDESRVVDFSCNKKACLFIMAPEEVIKPSEAGMTHFYKNRSGEWTIIT